MTEIVLFHSTPSIKPKECSFGKTLQKLNSLSCNYPSWVCEDKIKTTQGANELLGATYNVTIAFFGLLLIV